MALNDSGDPLMFPADWQFFTNIPGSHTIYPCDFLFGDTMRFTFVARSNKKKEKNLSDYCMDRFQIWYRHSDRPQLKL